MNNIPHENASYQSNPCHWFHHWYRKISKSLISTNKRYFTTLTAKSFCKIAGAILFEAKSSKIIIKEGKVNTVRTLITSHHTALNMTHKQIPFQKRKSQVSCISTLCVLQIWLNKEWIFHEDYQLSIAPLMNGRA